MAEIAMRGNDMAAGRADAQRTDSPAEYTQSHAGNTVDQRGSTPRAAYWMFEAHFLPPVPGRCPLCGGNHTDAGKHDEKSAYYQMILRQRARREVKRDA